MAMRRQRHPEPARRRRRPLGTGGSVVTPIDPERCRLAIGGWSWAGSPGLFITFDTDLSDINPPALQNAFRITGARLQTQRAVT